MVSAASWRVSAENKEAVSVVYVSEYYKLQ